MIRIILEYAEEVGGGTICGALLAIACAILNLSFIAAGLIVFVVLALYAISGLGRVPVIGGVVTWLVSSGLLWLVYNTTAFGTLGR